MKDYLKWFIAVVIAALMFIIGFTYFDAFSAFFAAILIIAGAGGLFFLIDKYLIIGFDTIEELKKGNIAVSLYVLGYCILIGCCVIASFVVYR